MQGVWRHGGGREKSSNQISSKRRRPACGASGFPLTYLPLAKRSSAPAVPHAPRQPLGCLGRHFWRLGLLCAASEPPFIPPTECMLQLLPVRRGAPPSGHLWQPPHAVHATPLVHCTHNMPRSAVSSQAAAAGEGGLDVAATGGSKAPIWAPSMHASVAPRDAVGAAAEGGAAIAACPPPCLCPPPVDTDASIPDSFSRVAQ